MAESGSETEQLQVYKLPLLDRDSNNNYYSPLRFNLENISKRVAFDKFSFAQEFDAKTKKRDLLGIEYLDGKSVIQTIDKVEASLQWIGASLPPMPEVLKNIATYLDWSYQKQTGVLANASSLQDAEKHGIGAIDAWTLFTSIKNKLEEKKSQ